MSTKSPANLLTNQILDFFFANRIFAYRANSLGVYDSRKGIFRSSPKKGISDLIAIIPPHGRFIGIEIKIGKDKQSEEQKGFQSNILRAGGVYLIARDYDSFIREITPHLPPS